MSKPIKLHLGAGPNIIKGWINYDIEPHKGGVFCDLREPLPHKDGSVDMIFSEHVIEHFSKKEGKALIEECFRVLKPGAAMRIGWPGMEKLLWAVVTRNQKYKNYIMPALEDEFNGWDEFMSDCLFSWEHRYAYTSKHLTRVLKNAGFKNIKKKTFGQSEHGFNNDVRNDPATTYLEATK